MKKVFGLLIVMSFFYLLIQYGFQFLEKGHLKDYKIKNGDNEFLIHEVFTTSVKSESDNYYIEIQIDDIKFDYQTTHDFFRQNKIVKNIEYYKDDNYACILPIYSGDVILSDIICKKGDIYYYYHDIKDKYLSLDTFASSLSKYGYDVNKYMEHSEYLTSSENINVYNNLLQNHFVALENYKGLYTVNLRNMKKIHNIMVFKNDIYKKNISAFAGKYYLVADYEQDYKFNKFILVNIVDNSEKQIIYDYDITLDSYVQGVIGNCIYIFDRTTLRQYEIDVKSESIIEVGNSNIGIKKYINGSFQMVGAHSNEFTFTKYSTDNIFNGVSYPKVDKTGIEKSGYYYIYQYDGKKYNVYRSNIQNGNTKTYLFSTDNLDSVTYLGEMIYYREKDSIKRYSDQEGISIILSTPELSVNQDYKKLKYYVYQK